MTNTSRRKAEDRQREIYQEVERILGESEICDRCHCTVFTFGDKCSAALGDMCPGFNRIDEVRAPIVARVYGFKEAGKK